MIVLSVFKNNLRYPGTGPAGGNVSGSRFDASRQDGYCRTRNGEHNASCRAFEYEAASYEKR